MNLRVIGNKLLIEPLYDDYRGAIAIPEITNSKKWNRNTGVLHAFGEKVKESHPHLKCGMHLVFKPYNDSTHEIELRGKTFLFINVDAVIGVME